jgi:hypothetical protein
MLLTFNSGVKWSENAANYQEKVLKESRKVLCAQFSMSLETIQFDIYIIAMGAFRDATRIVRTPFSFSTNLF